MAFHKHGRQYDLIVFGATGYTGKYTAQHITTNLPTDLKWAIAGRSHDKLEKLAAEIKPLNPDRRQPGQYLSSLVAGSAVLLLPLQWLTASTEIEICELNDEQLVALAKKTFVLITTVGPYGLYGEHVSAAHRRSPMLACRRLTSPRHSKPALKMAHTTLMSLGRFHTWPG